MKRIMSVFLIAAFVGMLLPINVGAAVPKVMTYHGLLKDAGGNYLSGSYAMTFRIYGAATGGSVLWTEIQPGVSVSSGRFSVQLGAVNPISLTFIQDYWLSLAVGQDAEMTPRQKLTSVGYTYLAEMANDVVGGKFSKPEHDASDHKEIVGVKRNTVDIAKTNFKLDAYTKASANSLNDMVVDAFNDAAGIDASTSSGYTWRGNPNYDVTGQPPVSVEYPFSKNNTNELILGTGDAWVAGVLVANGGLGQQFQATATGALSQLSLGFYDSDTGSWEGPPWLLYVEVYTQGADGLPAVRVGTSSDGVGVEQVNATWASRNPTILTFKWSANAPNLVNGQNYVLAVFGYYPYGDKNKSVRVAADSAGTHAGRGVYSNANTGTWMYLPGNYDLTFSLSIGSGGGSADVRSINFTALGTNPSKVMLMSEKTLNSGGITFYVSRDGGVTWTQAAESEFTALASQPSGSNIRWRAVMTGNAELESIALAT